MTSHHDLRILNGMVNDSSEQLTTIFMALSDPTRRAILERLAHGEASGTELARPFSISLPAISKHLRVLKNAHLILHRKDGRTHMFRLAASPMRDAAAWLEQYRHFWEAQLGSNEMKFKTQREGMTNLTPPIHPDYTLDLGEKNCSQLIMEVMLLMRYMGKDQTLLVTAYDQSAPIDLEAWCRMTGNTLVQRLPDSTGNQFLLRKG
ncbi:MAG TPA: metalloregulator ArsR/SmtB family transcription factor [Ktedonobacteraceae bacterium]|nr:metalloregulator ArsR/SmtB family transcription factor [Ktedonobacteraceae bacterium]